MYKEQCEFSALGLGDSSYLEMSLPKSVNEMVPTAIIPKRLNIKLLSFDTYHFYTMKRTTGQFNGIHS